MLCSTLPRRDPAPQPAVAVAGAGAAKESPQREVRGDILHTQQEQETKSFALHLRIAEEGQYELVPFMSLIKHEKEFASSCVCVGPRLLMPNTMPR